LRKIIVTHSFCKIGSGYRAINNKERRDKPKYLLKTPGKI